MEYPGKQNGIVCVSINEKEMVHFHMRCLQECSIGKIAKSHLPWILLSKELKMLTDLVKKIYTQKFLILCKDMNQNQAIIQYELVHPQWGLYEDAAVSAYAKYNTKQLLDTCYTVVNFHQNLCLVANILEFIIFQWLHIEFCLTL
uniref:Uncharacterized protein n=1 Tax=Tetranychus urticae TaxID=32264 RepID=T1JWN0_TETUR